jgi:hypothetical protein
MSIARPSACCDSEAVPATTRKLNADELSAPSTDRRTHRSRRRAAPAGSETRAATTGGTARPPSPPPPSRRQIHHSLPRRRTSRDRSADTPAHPIAGSADPRRATSNPPCAHAPPRGRTSAPTRTHVSAAATAQSRTECPRTDARTRLRDVASRSPFRRPSGPYRRRRHVQTVRTALQQRGHASVVTRLSTCRTQNGRVGGDPDRVSGRAFVRMPDAIDVVRDFARRLLRCRDAVPQLSEDRR